MQDFSGFCEQKQTSQSTTYIACFLLTSTKHLLWTMLKKSFPTILASDVSVIFKHVRNLKMDKKNPFKFQHMISFMLIELNLSIIHILIAIIKINQTHSFHCLHSSQDLSPTKSSTLSSGRIFILFQVFVCETNWVRCSTFWSQTNEGNEKKKSNACCRRQEKSRIYGRL